MLLALSGLLLQSCISRKEITYFQSTTDSLMVQDVAESYEALLRPGDIVSIQVSSLSKEASSFFNEIDDKTGAGSTYLVSAGGTINFPMLGLINVAGKSTRQLTEELRISLEKYLVEPGVRIRLQNFKITILGEVAKPGVYPVINERITLLEAIGLAGDLTVYGRRKNVLLIREENGKREFIKIDLTDPNILTSPAYQLHNNDVVYVEPGKGKVASAEEVYRILPIVFSGLTALGLFLQRVL